MHFVILGLLHALLAFVWATAVRRPVGVAISTALALIIAFSIGGGMLTAVNVLCALIGGAVGLTYLQAQNRADYND
ncbi:hypothetical protein FACS189487_11460 [Campylobacterota bacterium]|nr:hypothetical protein FACS189487_11460 [Campylobacterota bacterium]